MAVRRVRRTTDSRTLPRWRVELHEDGWWRVLMFGGAVRNQLSEPEVRAYLAEQGVDWDTLVED